MTDIDLGDSSWSSFLGPEEITTSSISTVTEDDVCEKAVNEVIRENKRLDDDTFYKQIDYDHLVPLLINSVKELKTEIEELKQKLKEK